MSLTTPANVVTDIVDLTGVKDLCRICLTKSTSMILMNSPLSKEISPKPTILEALEKVMSVKLIMNKKYPSTICGMCKGLLKISHDLNLIFNKSQTTLAEYFEEGLCDNEISSNKNVRKNVAPVELIFGNNKYNLNDVVIVEDETKEENNFQGFLNNLGSTVSAVFVDKSDKSKKRDQSNLNLDKHIVTLEPSESNTLENRGETVVEISLDELQDCNVTDLFPDHEILIPSQKNPEDVLNTVNGQVIEEIVDQNIDKENLILRKIYKCDACDVLCANRTRLKLHLLKHHIHQVPYLCDMCSAVSFYAKDGIQATPNSEIISCEECGSVNTKRKIPCNKQADTKTVVREYLCQICGHISKNSSSARYHKKKHFQIQYHCNMCDKKYHSKATLQWHINCHNNVKNLLCSVCGKKFNYYSALVYHMRMHTNDKRFMCEICDKRFYMRNALKRHIRMHTGERIFICEYCAKGFLSQEERKKHEKIHTGQRPYKCHYCDKRFLSAFNRKMHHMTHPGPHECDYCCKTFVELEFLKLHLKAKHEPLAALAPLEAEANNADDDAYADIDADAYDDDDADADTDGNGDDDNDDDVE